MINNVEAIKQKLRQYGLKATHQRMAVLTVLSDTNIHPSAEMIMESLKEQEIHMSFATVYNVLETFLQVGLIQKLTDSNEVMRFDFNTSFHIHIFDETTGKIIDYFDDSFCNDLQHCIMQKFSIDGEIKKINLSVQTKS